MQPLYLVLCLAGAALPLSQFVPWLAAHGLHLPLLLQQASASSIAAFAWADVLVSGIAVAVFVVVEGRRLAMPPVVAASVLPGRRAFAGIAAVPATAGAASGGRQAARGCGVKAVPW